MSAGCCARMYARHLGGGDLWGQVASCLLFSSHFLLGLLVYFDFLSFLPISSHFLLFPLICFYLFSFPLVSSYLFLKSL